jgi:hypothetical protein
MASHPPAECCTIGVKHEGEAQGEMKKIGEGKFFVFFLIECSISDMHRRGVFLVSKGQEHRKRRPHSDRCYRTQVLKSTAVCMPHLSDEIEPKLKWHSESRINLRLMATS